MKSFFMQLDGRSRKRDLPKRTWMEVTKIDLKYNLSEDLAMIDWNGKTEFMYLNPNS